MKRIVSVIFIVLAFVMMQAVEFIPHHHHDGIIICLEEDSGEGDEDDETLCVTKASFLLNETHHELYLSAFIPVFELESLEEPQSFRVDARSQDQTSLYTAYRPGPSALRAPPVSSI